MNLGGVGDESAVNVDAILDSLEGCEGGPSRGGFSWHTIAPAQACWRRAYFELVLGLKKNLASPALALGSLVHACFELHYKSGGVRTFEPCDAVAAAGAVKVAGDAKRYVYAQLEKYGAEEASTWDVRGVEEQGTWFMPPEKIGGRTVHIPLTCRYDLIVALRQPGAPCTPPGQPAPSGVSIVDFKTAKALTYDLTKGYSMDGQFLTNALVYRQQGEVFGPLTGVIVSIIAKHKTMTKDSLFRVHTMADEGSVAEFYRDEIRPWSIEIYRRLSSQEMRDDMSRWPKCRASCVGPYGPCFYFDICDTPPGGEDAVMADMYRVDASRIKDVTQFLEPSAEHKRSAGKTDQEVAQDTDKREAARQERAALKRTIVTAFAAGVSSYPEFQSSAYLQNGAKPKDVRSALAGALQGAWSIGTRFELMLLGDDPDDKAGFIITSKGISWVARGKRGSWTFKSFASELSRSWWDPTYQTTTSAESDSDNSAPPVPSGPMAAPLPPQQ